MPGSRRLKDCALHDLVQLQNGDVGIVIDSTTVMVTDAPGQRKYIAILDPDDRVTQLSDGVTALSNYIRLWLSGRR
jgi:hypothetical protein